MNFRVALPPNASLFTSVTLKSTLPQVAGAGVLREAGHVGDEQGSAQDRFSHGEADRRPHPPCPRCGHAVPPRPV